MFKLCIIFYYFSVVFGAREDYKIVEIKQGSLKAFRDKNVDIFPFYGIPYATEPKGVNRFKAPLPPPEWSGIKEAIDDKIICPQYIVKDNIPDTPTVTDNCLVANVFVPNTNDTNLPVVVYIHGGAYQVGYGNFATPKHIVKKGNIIGVTFNYRLGVNGFLCLGTKDVPGNAGLRDQIYLLNWVKNNIQSFGGNPNEIALAGYSAGSASADLLMLSDAAKGLFNKIILESGSAVESWSVQIDPIKNARYVAELLGFKSTSLVELENFFKNALETNLTNLGVNFLIRQDSQFVMSPCVERDVGQEIIIRDYPMNTFLKQNFTKLPSLIGTTSMEGLFRKVFFEQWRKKMSERFTEFMPADLTFEDEDKKEKVAKKLKHLYFDNTTIGEHDDIKFYHYFSDIEFSYSITKSAKLSAGAGNSNVYFYEFTFVPKTNTIVENEHSATSGADHCSQTYAVLEVKNHQFIDDCGIKDIVRDAWINFIKTGKPVPVHSEHFPEGWVPSTGTSSPYMILNCTPKIERSRFRSERYDFLDEIYKAYYGHPVAPSV